MNDNYFSGLSSCNFIFRNLIIIKKYISNIGIEYNKTPYDDNFVAEMYKSVKNKRLVLWYKIEFLITSSLR